MRILIRLDDFTPNRNKARWEQVETILDRHGIRPLVAVVPNDKYFGTAATTDEFWQQVRRLQDKSWTIALHGETHLVLPIAPGTSREIFFATKSEFVGLPLEAQVQKLNSAWNEFASRGVRPVAFVAPNHGFDANTVRAVAGHGAMRFIGDGISLRLFKDRGLVWLPQIDWRIPSLPCGFRTVCLHPSTLSAVELRKLESAVERVAGCFVGVHEIEIERIRNRGFAEHAFERVFSVYFRIKEALQRLRASTRKCEG